MGSLDLSGDAVDSYISFIKSKGLARQHIESFNHFSDKEIKQIMEANQFIDSDIDPSFFLRYTNIYIGSPKIDENMITYEITPQECRLRDLTYSAPILVDVEYVRGKQLVSRKEVVIGKLPIMLRSSHCVLSKCSSYKDYSNLRECPLDTGGYFIIRGAEKVILIQEQLSKNRILVDRDKKGYFFAQVTSSTYERKSKTYVILKNDKMYLRHNAFIDDIPLIIVLKAMDMVSEYEIASSIGSDIYDLLVPSFEECFQLKIFSKENSIAFIQSKIRISSVTNGDNRNIQRNTLQTLNDLVLSHVPSYQLNMKLKALFLCHMIRKVILVKLNRIQIDDRDFVGNKRLELAGQLVSILFEDLFKRFNADLKRNIDKVLSRQNRAAEFDAARFLQLQSSIITAGLERAIATGNWVVKRFRMERAGITQVLSRLSFISAIGMMTRVTSQFEKTRKVSGPRALQPSQWGVLCPSDTPEGETCGLVKNLALLAYITCDIDDETIIGKILKFLGVIPICLLRAKYNNNPNAWAVMLNGCIVGYVSNFQKFIHNFKEFRRSSYLRPFISISKSDNNRCISIATDSGRVCRPLIIVKKSDINDFYHLKDDIGFNEAIQTGLIEFLDINEENDSLIALTKNEIIDGQTTHLEIASFTILGAVAGLIPFPHHNQSPRNTYQCAMGKQSIGSIALNQLERLDSLLYLMIYPQRPLVKTKIIDFIDFDDLPAGQNAIVAVMSFSGYDIEDALILNKASIDRGFGRCSVLKKFSAQLKKYANGRFDRIISPGNDAMHYFSTTNKHECLESDGISGVGERLCHGQVYLNRQTPSLNDNEFKNAPLTYKLQTPSFVDKVLLTSNEDQLLIKTLIRQIRRPEIGDKFSSRHGQKGVCGLIVDSIDLPFSSESGLIPDIVMNPHGFPSRMTVGKLLELLTGKVGIISGKFGDGTAFNDYNDGGENIRLLYQSLELYGFKSSGKESMISGTTGENICVDIFLGPVYYQKLKHMVLDKMHARARGPRAVLTRQPTEGRSRDGGLRLGEMERDCLIGYGASSLLTERLMLSSDVFDIYLCQSCGLIGYLNWCRFCKSSVKIASVKIPYACKLLFQELLSMNITPRIDVQILTQ